MACTIFYCDQRWPNNCASNSNFKKNFLFYGD